MTRYKIEVRKVKHNETVTLKNDAKIQDCEETGSSRPDGERRQHPIVSSYRLQCI